jgi:hypothetical protein
VGSPFFTLHSITTAQMQGSPSRASGSRVTTFLDMPCQFVYYRQPIPRNLQFLSLKPMRWDKPSMFDAIKDPPKILERARRLSQEAFEEIGPPSKFLTGRILGKGQVWVSTRIAVPSFVSNR